MLKNLPRQDSILHLSDPLERLLEHLRKRLHFSAGLYIQRKSVLLNRYMRKMSLNTCVVAVSGGVDSAVVLGLIKHASKQKNSPIKNIYAISLPVFSKGATNQKEAADRAKMLTSFFDVSLTILDITKVHGELKKMIDGSIRKSGNSWADGQLISYLRTPVLYYLTSLMAQDQKGAIICGTTNLDEGSYIGYFGKAADGMVDVQVIADIHKSEVINVAIALSVPRDIIRVVPSGDMFDGRVDEEVFGLTYDCVELVLRYKMTSVREQQNILFGMTSEIRRTFQSIEQRIEQLHKVNKHKYLGNPAVHLNILPVKIHNGWNNRIFRI